MDNLKTIELIKEIEILEREHQDLDKLISNAHLDQLTIQRIKKRKLWIKDRLTSIRSIIRPDIIA